MHGKRIEGGAWGIIKEQMWYPVIESSEESRELIFPSEQGRRFAQKMQEKGTQEARTKAKL